jgi:hypothetical protein
MANKNPKNNQRADRAANRKADNVKISPEEQRVLLAKQFGIKQKTKDFIDDMLEHPEETARDIYLKHHKTNNKNTASTAVNKLLKKPSVIGYKDSAVGKAKRKVIALVDSPNDSIALKASEAIIDRMEGKAIQRNETTSKTVTVKLDLQGLKLGAHYIRPELNTPITE